MISKTKFATSIIILFFLLSCFALSVPQTKAQTVFGYNSIGTSNYSFDNVVFYSAYSAPTSAPIDSIYVYLSTSSPSNVQVALYSSTGVLLDNSSASKVFNGAGWISVPLESNYDVVAGTTYLLALDIYSGGLGSFYYDVGTVNQTGYTPQIFGSMPTTLTGVTTQNNEISIYAHYYVAPPIYSPVGRPNAALILGNTMLIQNAFWLTGRNTIQGPDILVDTTKLNAVAAECSANHINTVIVGSSRSYENGSVKFEDFNNFAVFTDWNSNDTGTYQQIVSVFHAYNIKVLLWSESTGVYPDLTSSTIRANLASGYLTAVNNGNFDGIFSDLESPIDQNAPDYPNATIINAYCNFVGNETLVMHGLNKYFTISEGIDNGNVLYPYVHCDMAYIQWYISFSEFEDTNVQNLDWMWQETFAVASYNPVNGDQAHYLPSASPQDILIMDAPGNSQDFAFQLNTATTLINTYGTGTQEVGFGVWMYEYMLPGDLTLWGNWVSSNFASTNPTVTATPSPTPIPTSTTQSLTASPITLNDAILFLALFALLAVAFHTEEPFWFVASGFICILCGIDLELLFANNSALWGLEFIGLIVIGIGCYIFATSLQTQLKTRKNKRGN